MPSRASWHALTLRATALACVLAWPAVHGAAPEESFKASSRLELKGDEVAGTEKFTLATKAIAWTHIIGTPLPAPSVIPIKAKAKKLAMMAVGYTATQQQVGWLAFALRLNSSNKPELVVWQNDAVPGTGTKVVQFSVAEFNRKGKIVQITPVTVTYTQHARVEIGPSASPVAVSLGYGHSTTTQALPLTIAAAERSWTATSSAPWLKLSATGGFGDGALTATIDAAGLLPGTRQATVVVTNPAHPGDAASLTVDFDLATPTLSVGTNALTLGGADGLGGREASFDFGVDTGTAEHPFTVELTTASGGWLRSDLAAGTVAAAGRELSLTADRTGIPGGTYHGNAKVTVTVGALTLARDVPVVFNLEANRLVVDAVGVGFTSLPGIAVLERELHVHSAFGQPGTTWVAHSDSPWLAATAAGAMGGSLRLSADPAGLAPGMHYANVIVGSDDPTVENEELVRVGLYVGDAASTTVTLSQPNKQLAASPVDPVVFVANGGTTIKAFHVYTGAVLFEISGTVGAAHSLRVSPDGRHLFVYDASNLRVSQFDARSGAFLRHWGSAPPAGHYGPLGGALQVARPAGRDYLIVPSATVYDLVSGADFRSDQFRSPQFAEDASVSGDGKLYVANFGMLNRLAHSALEGDAFRTTRIEGYSVGGGKQACFSADATRVYSTSIAGYNFAAYSVADGQLVQVLPGTAYPNSLVCPWNGLVVTGMTINYGAEDVWVYDGSNGVLLGKRASADWYGYKSMLDRGMAVSADGRRLVTLQDSSGTGTPAQLVFQDLPAPPAH